MSVVTAPPSVTVLGLDVGTSAVKGLLLDTHGNVVAAARRSYPLDLPAPGHVELSADRVWRAAAVVISRLADAGRRAGSPVRALAASGSGDDVTMVDREGDAVGPVIVALDTRSSAEGTTLETRYGPGALYARTGVALTGLSPLARYLWLRANDPVRAGRVHRLLAWPELVALRLGVEPRAEPTLAGRSLGYGLAADAYDARLLADLGIEPDLLPPVVPSGTPIGTVGRDVAHRLGLDQGVLVVTGGFDQAMATLGAGVVDAGTAHLGMGSYEALTAPLDLPLASERQRVAGWSVGRTVAGASRWSTMNSWLGGAALAWLARGTAHGAPTGSAPARGPTPARLMREAGTRPVRVLALAGLEAADGIFLGLDLGTGRGELAGALLEAVCMDLRRALGDLERTGIAVDTLRATGGGTRSRRWLQLTADVTGLPVERVAVREAGAFAAGLLAGAALGVLPTAAAAARDLVRVDLRVEPRLELRDHYAYRAELHAGLRAAIQPLRGGPVV